MNLFWAIAIKTLVVHTLTYFAVGFTAFKLFHYTATLNDASNNMRPSTHPLVRAGVLFQPLRGFLFGIVFYLLQSVLFQPGGWLIMWVMLVVVGILSTFAPAGGSIEGFIYLRQSGRGNRGGIVEILAQSFLFSVLTYYWVNHSEQVWLSWMLGVLFVIAVALPALGLLVGKSSRQ